MQQLGQKSPIQVMHPVGSRIAPEQVNKIADIMDLFEPVEGEVTLYYGRIRNGKTYAATADILELLDRGEVVYANWNVNWDGQDQRESFGVAVAKMLTGRQDFFHFKRENFHYINPDDIDIAYLGRLVNVHIFIDEGQWIFNSHVKNHDPETRKLILHNGHYCRSLNIITQRPVNIFKDMRSQVNVWYKCEKRLSWPFIVFQKTRIEDMKDDLPDEENPVGRPKTYIADKRVFKAYSTHAMRKDDAIDDIPQFDVYETTRGQRIMHVLGFMLPAWLRRRTLRRAAALDVKSQQRRVN